MASSPRTGLRTVAVEERSRVTGPPALRFLATPIVESFERRTVAGVVTTCQRTRIPPPRAIYGFLRLATGARCRPPASNHPR
jgi:hypothetical protein